MGANVHFPLTWLAMIFPRVCLKSSNDTFLSSPIRAMSAMHSMAIVADRWFKNSQASCDSSDPSCKKRQNLSRHRTFWKTARSPGVACRFGKPDDCWGPDDLSESTPFPSPGLTQESVSGPGGQFISWVNLKDAWHPTAPLSVWLVNMLFHAKLYMLGTRRYLIHALTYRSRLWNLQNEISPHVRLPQGMQR